VIQQTLINLDIAYKNFFKNGSGFPKFKKKMNPMNVRFPFDAIIGTRSSKKAATIKGNRINLIKQLKDIHFKCSRQDEIDLNKYQKSIKSATLSKDKTNGYYLSILLDKPLKSFKNKGNGTVGIDLGIKDFVITSEGQTYDNLNFNKRQQNKLKRYHRNLSRKQKGSKNKEKARLKLARLNKKINNQKQYYLHSIVNQLLSENQTIIMEDLNVKGMLKNHKLAKAIQDVSWYRFKEILKYKAKWYGKKIIEINRFFPSSKLCHVCGYKNSDLTLKDRTWDCPKCGTHLDRDLNAALNIKSEGLKILNRDELDRINASGVQVTRPTKKEETNCKIICTT
jgi:putative transposase